MNQKPSIAGYIIIVVILEALLCGALMPWIWSRWPEQSGVALTVIVLVGGALLWKGSR